MRMCACMFFLLFLDGIGNDVYSYEMNEQTRTHAECIFPNSLEYLYSIHNIKYAYSIQMMKAYILTNTKLLNCDIKHKRNRRKKPIH